MNTLHSSSSFRSSCVIQPRHPKTRLPTTAIERKSFDFSSLAQHGSSDDTSGTSSNENAKTSNENRRNSQLQRTKSAKRPSNIKRKSTSKSFSKSVSVGCEPQVINNSRINQTKRLLDTKSLSVDDDLFFRHLQALKEENKRALKTLERLYHFGQNDDVSDNNTAKKNTNTNYKKKTKTSQANSDEGITSDSNASRNSSENGLTQGNVDDDDGHGFKQRFSSNLRQCNVNGVSEMPAESVQANYIYGFNGNGLLKVAETRNGYSQQVGRHGNYGNTIDDVYNENRNGSKELRFERDSDRENLDLENEYSENDVETDNGKNEFSESNVGDGNDDSDSNVRCTSLERGYSLNERRHADAEYEENERNLGNGITRHPRNGFFSNHVVNGDNVSDMDKKIHDDRERRQASDSSEDELDEKLKVRAPSSHVNILPENERAFRGRQSNYDVIANMWNNFSVNDTVPYNRSTAGRRSFRKKHSPGWSPGVTIQEPFKMTLREEKMKEVKQKKIDRIKDELLQKQLEEEAELKKRVTPVPIPPSTFLPIFSEKQQLEQEKKLQMKEASKQLLKSIEKPFSFLQREEAKNKLKRSQSMSAKIDTSKANFKANPYPDKIFDLTWKDKEAEQAEYRKIKIKLRSQELLAQSSLPPSMATRGDIKNYRNDKNGTTNSTKKKKKEKNFQPQVHHVIPDFQEMQKKIEMALEARKNQNTPTVCEPFKLHTAQIPTRRSKFNHSIEKTKEPNPPPSRPGSSFARSNTINFKNNDRRPGSALFRSRSTSAQSSRIARSRSVSPVYSVTEAARLRQEHIRQSVEKEKLEKQKLKEEKKQKQREIQKLQRVVAQKTAAQDPTRFREKQTAEKLASFRRAEKERVREYKEFLRSVEQKNEQRPLLFERESQTNAKRQAQKRYEEILRRAGIDGKTLEAFIAGDRELHRQLAEQRADESGSEDEDENEEEEDDEDEESEVDDDDDDDDIPLKSDGMGYDVVLKSNNNSRSYDNNTDEEPGNETEDDDDEEDDEDEEEDDEDDDDEDEDEDDEDDDDSDVAPGADDDDDGEVDGDHDNDGNDVGYGNGNGSDVNEDVDSDGSYKP